MKKRKSKEQKQLTSLTDLYADYEGCCLRVTLATTTVSNYGIWHRRFLSSLPQPPTSAHVTRKACRTFLISAFNERPTGYSMACAAVNHFLRWLVKERELNANPLAGVELPSPPKMKRRDPAPDADVLKAIEATDRLPCKPFYRVRDRAVLSALAYGCLRRAELLALTPLDVDFRTGYVHIRCGKGGHPRDVAMCEELSESLAAWIGVREAAVKKSVPGNALFCFENGNALGRSALYGLIARACTVAGVPVFCPHSCRHGGATREALHGVPFNVIQQKLGHARLSTTTDIYIHEATKQQAAQFAHLSTLRHVAPAPIQAERANRKRKRISLRSSL